MLFETKAKQFDTAELDFGSEFPCPPSQRRPPQASPPTDAIRLVAPALLPAMPQGITPSRLRRLQTDFRDAFDLVSDTLPGLFRDRWVSWFYDADTACFQVLDRSGETILEARVFHASQWEVRLIGPRPLSMRDRSIFGAFRKLGLLPLSLRPPAGDLC